MPRRLRLTKHHGAEFTRIHAIILILACIALSFILASTENAKHEPFVSPLSLSPHQH